MSAVQQFTAIGTDRRNSVTARIWKEIGQTDTLGSNNSQQCTRCSLNSIHGDSVVNRRPAGEYTLAVKDEPIGRGRARVSRGGRRRRPASSER